MEPIRPDYEGRCLSNLVKALRSGADWVPAPIKGAKSIVLLVLDGLGAEEVARRAPPNLSSLEGAPITTVVPSTTPTALLSITTGLAPAAHGVIGYRLLVGGGVLNVLRWTSTHGKTPPDPVTFQPRDAFDGEAVPVVTRMQFRDTKFTEVQLRGARFYGWLATSALVEHCRTLAGEGERFVYAYYDGLDQVAHIHGMRNGFFEREVAFCDQLVGEMLDALPDDAALVVTADHGHVHFDERIELGELGELIDFNSGESRFRYLHAKEGRAADLLEMCTDRFSAHSWVFTREQLIDEGWFGPMKPTREVARRIGDVILAAREAIGYVDPVNPGESRLLSGHGSLTGAEMLVPLLGGRGRG